MLSKAESKRAYYLARYHAMRAKGVCVQCGWVPTRYAMCPECREKHNARRNSARFAAGVRGKHQASDKARYRKARSHKLCVSCGLHSERFSRCQPCRVKDNEARKATRARKRNVLRFTGEHLEQEAKGA